MKKILSVINQKGGVGKTASSLAIANVLHHFGYKVLVIDMDPQCNISYLSKANLNTYSILDVMLGDANARDVIQKTDLFDILVSNGNLASYSMRFNGDNREYRFKEVIEPVLNLYDYIVIDSPPTLGDISIGILTASTDFLIPTTCDVLSIEGMKQIYQTYKVVKKYTNPDLVCDGILITRCSERIDEMIIPAVNKVAASMNLDVFETRIEESRALRLALLTKKSLYDLDEVPAVLMQYENLVFELLGKWKGITE